MYEQEITITALKNRIYNWLSEEKQSAKKHFCSEQGLNIGKKFAIEKWGENATSFQHICFGLVCLCDSITRDSWKINFDNQPPFQMPSLDKDIIQKVSTICNKASTFNRTIGMGAAGAGIGFLFGGVVGAALGGIASALFGNNSAVKDRKRLYVIIQEALDCLFEFFYKEMSKVVEIMGQCEGIPV